MRPIAVTALLLVIAPAVAGAQTWRGSGPFPSSVNSRAVHALTADRTTGALYAGTGSGTVFAWRDTGLSLPPVATNDHAVTEPGMAVVIAVLANDTDPEGALDTSSVAIRSLPVNGTATVNTGGTVTWTPQPGFIGTDSFTYTVRDQAGHESNAATVSVRVNATPVAGNDTASTQEGEPVTIDVLANDSDPDGTLGPDAVAMWNSPVNGYTTMEPDGRITYVPDLRFSGTDTFTYRVRDDDGRLSNEATVTITVIPLPNVLPVAHDDSAGTLQDAAVTISVLANDIDTDGTLDAATVTVQAAPAHGSATVNAGGSITYAPDAGFSGTDSFTYTVADDEGGVSNAATVTVVVAAVGGGNVPPVAANDSVTTAHGAAVTISVLANDSDPDGVLDVATVTVQGEPANGTAAANAEGSITYTPNAGFAGIDSFPYTVADDSGAISNAATVTVTVAPAGVVNIPPVAMYDTATTIAGTPVTIDVLANDIEYDGTLQPATVAVQGAPANGSTAVNADGSITYAPRAGFTGTDSFTYTVADDAGDTSNPGTVVVSVNAVPPPPPPPPPPPRRGGGGSIELLTLAALMAMLLLRSCTFGQLPARMTDLSSRSIQRSSRNRASASARPISSSDPNRSSNLR